jgi:hypothetical protein
VTHIASYNTEKWRDELSPDVVKKIEEISFALIQVVGYPVIYANRQMRLSSTRLFLLKGIDAWNRLKFDFSRNGGIVKGLEYQYRKRRFG